MTPPGRSSGPDWNNSRTPRNSELLARLEQVEDRGKQLEANKEAKVGELLGNEMLKIQELRY